MRVCTPDVEGFVERDGVKVGYELYDNDAPTILLFPTWSIVHSRAWKGQLGYLSRHWRVVTVRPARQRPLRPPPRGGLRRRGVRRRRHRRAGRTGRTMRCSSAGRAVGPGRHLPQPPIPTGCRGLVLIAPGIPFTPHPRSRRSASSAITTRPRGGTSSAWRTGSGTGPTSSSSSHDQVFPSRTPPSSCEDASSWSLETDPDTIALTMCSRLGGNDDIDQVAPAASTARCWSCTPRATGSTPTSGDSGRPSSPVATLVTVDGDGHGLPAREPVFINRLLHDFAARATATPPTPTRRWTRGPGSTERVLYLSSPIGLGHVRRDLAIADELHGRSTGCRSTG
jgi:hypothetical protein